MKTRKVILEEILMSHVPSDTREYAVLEVLLDIRDLLANPPIEISGKQMTAEELRLHLNYIEAAKKPQ